MRKPILILLFSSSFLLIIFFVVLSFKYKKSDVLGGSVNSMFSSLESKSEIGVLEIEGVITSSDDILKKIRILKLKNEVKAVIVRVNSPGGAVAPSQEIYEELKKLDAIKPVVASFSSVAASGGYYIGVGAGKIVANAGTITGSIGVIMNLMDLQNLYKYIKVSPFVIKSGKFKDIGNSARAMTEQEKAILQNMSDDIHAQFKEAVSVSRKIPIKNLDEIADGRVFTGKQALDLGLIDYIGTFDDAIVLSANLAGVSEKSELYYPKTKKEGFRSLFTDVDSLLKLISNKLGIESSSSFM